MNLEKKLVLKFSKPYIFEGKEYEEVDLSCLENVTAQNMIDTQRLMQQDAGNILPELSLEYSCIISSQVARQPIEFFKGLPAKEAIKLKNMVTGFLFRED